MPEDKTLPVRKVHSVSTVSSTHPMWDTYAFYLDCGHIRNKRVYISDQVPNELRCADCRDGKPQVFNPKIPDMRDYYE